MLRGVYYTIRYHGEAGSSAPWLPRRSRDLRVQSFVRHQQRRILTGNFHSIIRRGSTLLRRGCVAAAMAGAGWVLFESARALLLF